jgi:hypothetical protein
MFGSRIGNMTGIMGFIMATMTSRSGPGMTVTIPIIAFITRGAGQVGGGDHRVTLTGP